MFLHRAYLLRIFFNLLWPEGFVEMLSSFLIVVFCFQLTIWDNRFKKRQLFQNPCSFSC